MPPKTSHTPTLALVFAVTGLAILSPPPAGGATNPIKPGLGIRQPTSIAGEETFVCGTYKGNEIESERFYHLYQGAMQKSKQQSVTWFVHDDVWVVEDDGTLLFSGVNAFDTDVATIRFTPNLSGGYDVSQVAFAYDPSFGGNLLLGDDTNQLVTFAFSFPFYGGSWSNVNVNANGIIAFGGIANPSGFFDPDDFFSSLPKIVPFFVDLNPAAGGAVYYKPQATKSTITWHTVPEFGTTNLNTVQLVLHDNGSIDVTFAGVATTLANNNLPITFGIHPGASPQLDTISFSDDLPYNGNSGAGIYETYYSYTDPLVNEVALMQTFYQNFPDVFFQLVFFTNFKQTMAGFANERNLSNDVQGIGLPIFDDSALFGSAGTLESRCNMNQLSVWPSDPEARVFGGQNNFLTIMGQESGHRWGAFIRFRDSNGNISNLILGRSDAHWSYFVDVDHSSLEGGNWEYLSGSTYITPTMIDYFGDIDEYIFGLRTPDEVTETFYVSSPSNDLPQNRDNGTPVQGATATGTPVVVTIDDIISAEGARTPIEADEEKDLRQAFMLIHRSGTTPTQAELTKIADFRKAWEDYFEIACDGRITCNTKLTTDLPVAVVSGIVRDATTTLPVADFTATAQERGFVQYVPSGGRYTFRFMPDLPPPPDSCCVTILFEAPGYVPRTINLCLPYGGEENEVVMLDPVVAGGIDDNTPGLAMSLEPSRPNPFNPWTTLTYMVPRAGTVRLAVYDLRGRLVRVLVDGQVASGSYDAVWDGRNERGEEVGSGVYFVLMTAGTENLRQKLVLLR